MRHLFFHAEKQAYHAGGKAHPAKIQYNRGQGDNRANIQALAHVPARILPCILPHSFLIPSCLSWVVIDGLPMRQYDFHGGAIENRHRCWPHPAFQFFPQYEFGSLMISNEITGPPVDFLIWPPPYCFRCLCKIQTPVLKGHFYLTILVLIKPCAMTDAPAY